MIGVPASVPPDAELVGRVVDSTGLDPEVARRVVEDVVAYHAEPVAGFVRRRHAELQTAGARNPEIFAQIAQELTGRVVAAPELSERQLRRLVYG
ncbi:MAG TPA: hypothetical protein VD814_09425 [Nocardioides sp.]|nr:hypothetical protein [Nocardioides sp.]